jgi:putative hydrolase of HD superfamily
LLGRRRYAPGMHRLQSQMEFLLEADKLKRILRRNHLSDASRLENDAEHSWYFALAALVLAEHSRDPIDLGKVLRMALIHDIVEIDAGDTFIYDSAASQGQGEREERAATRLYGLLPEDQAATLIELWREFERAETAEARFAKAIDRLAAVILNYASEGKTWRQHHVTKDKVIGVNQRIAAGLRRTLCGFTPSAAAHPHQSTRMPSVLSGAPCHRLSGRTPRQPRFDLPSHARRVAARVRARRHAPGIREAATARAGVAGAPGWGVGIIPKKCSTPGLSAREK